MTTWRGGEPKRRSRSSAIAGGDRRGSAARHPDRLQPRRCARRADREDRGPVGGGASLRVERAQGFDAGHRHLVLGGDQDRRPDRRRHQHRGGDRGLGRGFVDQRHRRRSLGVVGRGEDGERRAGGVGGRVVAADPGRVLGREGRVAELGGRLRAGGRLVPFRGLGAADRRRGAVDGISIAAAAEDRGEDEDDGEHDGAADQLQRQRDPQPPRGRFGGGFGGFRAPLPLGLSGRNLRVDRSLSGHSGKLQARTGWPVR